MTCMASPGYYLDSSFIPTPCYSTMPGCQLCSSATVCTLCNATHNYILSSTRCQAADGYYLDSNSMPTLCNMFACRLCSSATSCTGCLPSPRYVLTSGTCSCNGALNWILSADGLSCFCDNSTMNLFYAAFTQSCELCTLPGCHMHISYNLPSMQPHLHVLHVKLFLGGVFLLQLQREQVRQPDIDRVLAL